MSRKALALFLVVVALLLTPSPVLAQASPAVRLFARMLQAEQTLEFVGTVSEEVVFPDRRDEPQARHFMHPPGVSPELVERNFQMAITGRETVADRNAVVLRLVPKNGVSPNWTFWVDEETGLRLAYEQRDANGELLASGRAQQIERVNLLGKPRDVRAPHLTPALKERVVDFIDLDALPDGFVPVALERTRLGGENGVFALRLTLWDGLNGTVLLIYPRQRPVPDRRYLMSRELRNVTVSALGPLPDEALRSWLTRVAEGPVHRLTARQLRQLQRDSDRSDR